MGKGVGWGCGVSLGHRESPKSVGLGGMDGLSIHPDNGYEYLALASAHCPGVLSASVRPYTPAVATSPHAQHCSSALFLKGFQGCKRQPHMDVHVLLRVTRVS